MKSIALTRRTTQGYNVDLYMGEDIQIIKNFIHECAYMFQSFCTILGHFGSLLAFILHKYVLLLRLGGVLAARGLRRKRRE